MSCCNIIKSTCVELVGGVLQITIPPTIFRNKERRKLVVCQPIPALPPGTNPVIQIVNGATPLLTLNCIGNVARAAEINCRRAYTIVYGNDPEHISILTGLSMLTNCRCGDGYVPVV